MGSSINCLKGRDQCFFDDLALLLKSVMMWEVKNYSNLRDVINGLLLKHVKVKISNPRNCCLNFLISFSGNAKPSLIVVALHRKSLF